MENLMNELNLQKKETQEDPIITVIGVGGGGGNALNYMWKLGIKDVNFLACNTDAKALRNLHSNFPEENKIILGKPEDSLYGLGAGNDPVRGRELATYSIETIRQFLEQKKTKMVFIAAGMGGGTGTGAAPVIAKLAHEMGILTVANVTSPMLSEGPARCNQAAEGIDELKKYVDSLLVLNNDSIRQQFGKLPVTKAFSKADDVLASATKGIAEIITVDSAFIRVDFADLEKVMRGSGRAHMGVAKASGDGRAMEAARLSLCSPLLDSNSISGSTKVLINIAAKEVDNITYEEVNEIVDYIQAYASCKLDDNSTQNANIIWGVSSKATLGDDEIEVVVVATGFNSDDTESAKQPYFGGIEISPKDIEKPIEPKGPLSNPEKDKEKTKEADENKKREDDSTRGILDRRQPKFAHLDTEMKIPAFRRRNVGMIENNVTGARKESFRIESSDDAVESSSNELFR